MADAVELRGIRKTYDHFVAVERLSLNIREGSVYGLLGPNGAGKTSTTASHHTASAICRRSAASTRR